MITEPYDDDRGLELAEHVLHALRRSVRGGYAHVGGEAYRATEIQLALLALARVRERNRGRK